MCYQCLDVLLAHLAQTPAPPLLETSIHCPLFVTYEKEQQLRGCIGNLAPQPLQAALPIYAIHSAVHDRRFAPITQKEVPHLSVSVSLLVEYETCQRWDDWSIGVHGVVIKFSTDGVDRSATFLPEVAAQQKWNHRQTIMALIQKAGAPKGRVVDLEALHCTRFQSSKCKVTYDEYAASRKLHQAKEDAPSSEGCFIV